MNRKVLIVCLAATICGWVGASLAQEPQPLREDMGVEGGVDLSLSQALEIALTNNLDIAVSRIDPAIAEKNVTTQSAAFDPTWSAGANYFESKDEPFNPADLTNQEAVAANTGIGGTLPFGASYEAQLSASKFDASGALFAIQSSYNADLDLTFRLPLLKGFGTEVASEQLLIARRNTEISEEEFRRRLHDTVESVEGAYWDVVAAGRALGVARRKLRRAEELLDLNKKKVEVGTLAPIEITQAEAEVAANQEGVIAAETTMQNAFDALRRLLGLPREHEWWVEPLVPTDRPDFQSVEIDLEASIEEALARRPELISARKQLINKELSERVARRNTRPRLDLVANWDPKGNNRRQDPGPDGIPNTIDDQAVVDGSLSDALTEIGDATIYSSSVALNFSIPIGNRAAKAQSAIATLDRQKSETSLRNQEQSIRVEVRRAVREVESGFKRVEAARANVRLQTKKLEAEQKKFENGLSTSFEVLTFQNDLADAELSLVRAGLDYVRAQVALDKAKGSILEARGLTVEQARTAAPELRQE